MNAECNAFPRLERTLTVLVAGHRKGRLGEQAGPALRRLDAVLARFAQVKADALLGDALFGAALYAASPCAVRVMTGTADGVDAHAVAAAQALDLPLQLVAADAVAPACAAAPGHVSFGCPPEVLQHDDAAYALRDELALLHADVLLAVWDGQAPQGRAGGVVRLIQRAAQSGVPVLWINPAGEMRELELSKLDNAVLFHVSTSVFTQQNLEGGYRIFSEPINDPITATIRLWLDPVRGTHRGREAAALRRYAGEREGRLRGIAGAASCQADAGLPACLAGAPVLLARFAWSDARSRHAAALHRGGVWLLYLLSAFAVMAAVAGALHANDGHHGWAAWMWPALEGLSLAAILSIVVYAKKKEWHARWLGHRYMAEQLRYLIMTQAFLAAADVFSAPLFNVDEGSGQLSLQSAEIWLLRRTLSSQGLPRKEHGYNYYQADHAMLSDALAAIIKGQIAYQDGKARRLHGLQLGMQQLARALFGCSLLAVAAHPVLPALGMSELGWLLFPTAFFPALGASLYGIQTKLEIGRLQSMAQHISRQLAALESVLASHRTASIGHAWEQKMYLRQTALQAARIMTKDTQQWRALIGEQETEMPA